MSCLSPFFDDIPLTDSRQATISHKGFLFSNFAANLSWQISVKAFVKKAQFINQPLLSLCLIKWRMNGFMSCFAANSNICVKV